MRVDDHRDQMDRRSKKECPMKNTFKILAAALTIAAGVTSFVASVDAKQMDTHVTMRKCRMHHSLHYCALSVHQPNTNADHSKS